MGDILWPTFKNSQCPIQPITLSPPRLVPLLLLVDGQHTEHATCSQQRLLIHFPRIPTITHRSSLMTYNSE